MSNPAVSFEPFRHRLLGLAYRIVRNSSDAEDVVQEALAHGVPVVGCDVHGVAEAFDAESSQDALLPVDVPLEQAVAALEGVLLAAPELRAARRAQAKSPAG